MQARVKLACMHSRAGGGEGRGGEGRGGEGGGERITRRWEEEGRVKHAIRKDPGLRG